MKKVFLFVLISGFFFACADDKPVKEETKDDVEEVGKDDARPDSSESIGKVDSNNVKADSNNVKADSNNVETEVE